MTPELATDDGVTAPSAVRTVWDSPLYRGATVALFLCGVGTSAAAPQITLFLVDDLHASLTTAGLYYLTNITAPIAGYLIGARSDRTGQRLGLFRLCALFGFLGWCAMAAADRLWMPFVISALVLGFTGAAGSQLFAAVHDHLQAAASPVGDGVVSIVRMALTAGWIVGPVGGSLLATAAGPRVMLTATGLCKLAQIVPVGISRSRQTRPARERRNGRSRGSVRARNEAIGTADHAPPTHLHRVVRVGLRGRADQVRLFDDLHAQRPAPADRDQWRGHRHTTFEELILMPVAVVVAQRLLPQAVATASAIFMSRSRHAVSR